MTPESSFRNEILMLKSALNKRDHEIERLNAKLAAAEGALMILVQTQAERDAALAQVAGTYEAAAQRCDEHARHEVGREGAMLRSHSAYFRALTPTDALAARDRRDAQLRAEGRKEGLREAAGITLSHRERWRCAGGFEGYATGAKLIRDAILAAADKEASHAS